MYSKTGWYFLLVSDEKRLRTAANNDDYFNVLELLDSGVSACGADEKKRTALHFAAARGYDNIGKC